MLLLIGLLTFTGLSASPITTIRNIFIANPEKGKKQVEAYIEKTDGNQDNKKNDTDHFLKTSVEMSCRDALQTTFIGYKRSLIMGIAFTGITGRQEFFWPTVLGYMGAVNGYLNSYSYQPYTNTNQLKCQYITSTINCPDRHQIAHGSHVTVVNRDINNDDAYKIRSLFSQSSYIPHNITSSAVGILSAWHTGDPKIGLAAAAATRIGLAIISTGCNAAYINKKS